jgi:hypothetical protein
MRHSNTPEPTPLTFEKFPKASHGCCNFGGRLGIQGIKPVGIRTTPKPVVILSHVDHLYGTIYVTIVKTKETAGFPRTMQANEPSENTGSFGFVLYSTMMFKA